MSEVNCIAKVNTRTHFQALGERGVSNHFLLQDTQKDDKFWKSYRYCLNGID